MINCSWPVNNVGLKCVGPLTRGFCPGGTEMCFLVLMVFLIPFFPSSSLYCKNTMYNMYNRQNMCYLLFMFLVKFSVNSKLLIEFWGELKVPRRFSTMKGLSAPNPSLFKGQLYIK